MATSQPQLLAVGDCGRLGLLAEEAAAQGRPDAATPCQPQATPAASATQSPGHQSPSPRPSLTLGTTNTSGSTSPTAPPPQEEKDLGREGEQEKGVSRARGTGQRGGAGALQAAGEALGPRGRGSSPVGPRTSRAVRRRLLPPGQGTGTTGQQRSHGAGRLSAGRTEGPVLRRNGQVDQDDRQRRSWTGDGLLSWGPGFG